VWHDGSVVAHAARGTTRSGDGVPIDTRTLFDVASLTKPVVATMVARLVAEGGVGVHEAVFTRPEVTLTQLLAHRGGFPDWEPLYEQIDAKQRSTAWARRRIIELALSKRRRDEGQPGTEYSDLGFIAMIPWLEARSAAGLDDAIRRLVLEPLGMRRTCYRPGGHADPGIVATQNVAARGGLIQGVVHDDNAHAMGGISSHAGLFSTAAELGSMTAAVLRSRSDPDGWLPIEVARWLTDPVCAGGRTPGWDVPSGEDSSASKAFHSESFGHLGFTGGSIWADPVDSVIAILLTNRVHFGSENLTIRQFRPHFNQHAHDLALGR
jgi:CubicO group peptidase (beta-lactamase class C family)